MATHAAHCAQLGSSVHFSKRAAVDARDAGLISDADLVAARALHKWRDRAVDRWCVLFDSADQWMPSSPPRCGAASADVFASSPSALSGGAPMDQTNGVAQSGPMQLVLCNVAMPSLALVDLTSLLDHMIDCLAASLQARLQDVEKVQTSVCSAGSWRSVHPACRGRFP
jgi:hypothetical protein